MGLEETLIKSGDSRTLKDDRVCFMCKRFFCTDYHYPRHRIVCSGILPQWDWLYFLMREIKPSGTCKKFELHEVFKKQSKQR